MHVAREKLRQEHDCCVPFNEKYGQPALYVFETFLPAATFVEFIAQQEGLRKFLNDSSACQHVREIAIATHKTHCGTEKYMVIAKRMQILFGGPIDSETAEIAEEIFTTL